MSNFFPAETWVDARKPQSIFHYISYQRIGAFTAISDLVLILGASVAAGVAYHSFIFANDGDVAAFIAMGSYSGLIFLLVSKLLGLYQTDTLLSARAQIRGSLIAWGAVLLFVTSTFFLLKIGANYSRGATIAFGFVGLGSIFASHAIIGKSLQQALANGTLAGLRVIVIGDAEELAAKSPSHLLRTYGTQEIGRFELSTNPDRATTADDIAIINSGIKAAQANHAEQIVLALRWIDTDRRNLICERLRVLPLSVILLPDRSVNEIISQPHCNLRALSAIEVQPAPMSRHNLIVKRIFDFICAGLGLVLLSPLLLMTGLAIKLDSPGPVLFRQRRKGFNGHQFTIYKFRTMKVLEDGPSIRQAQRNDDRVTKLGRLLRASSIDELPQLMNVLTGEMSLIGPRPHAVAHDDEYTNSIDKYAFRHHVKPGITGWAQTHGFRGETVDVVMMKKRIQLDLWYINNWSFWLDLRIMARTCVELLRPRNAY